MKTKEEIQQQLVEEKKQLEMFQNDLPETLADAIVKEKGIARHKAKVSLLEWILEDAEVEPSVQYVVKSEMMIMGIEYFKNHDGKHATWVKNIYDAKRYHSEQLAIEEITLHWGFFPNWHSVEEYKGQYFSLGDSPNTI